MSCTRLEFKSLYEKLGTVADTREREMREDKRRQRQRKNRTDKRELASSLAELKTPTNWAIMTVVTGGTFFL